MPLADKSSFKFNIIENKIERWKNLSISLGTAVLIRIFCEDTQNLQLKLCLGYCGSGSRNFVSVPILMKFFHDFFLKTFYPFDT